MFWPIIPLAGHINKRYSGCIGRQVTGPFRSYSRALYKRSVKEQNRPKTEVQSFCLKVWNVLEAVIPGLGSSRKLRAKEEVQNSCLNVRNVLWIQPIQPAEWPPAWAHMCTPVYLLTVPLDGRQPFLRAGTAVGKSHEKRFQSRRSRLQFKCLNKARQQCPSICLA